MQVVQLRKGEGDEAEQDHPRLPVRELVVPVEDGAHEELNGGFGNEEAVGGENTAAGGIHSVY